MSHLNINSPLTGSNNVLIEEELDSRKIIDLYFNNYNIDVSDYFEGVESVKICRCLDTDYRFYYPLNLAGGSELYRELQKTDGYYSSGKWEHQVAINFIPEKCLALEVGCGTGNFLKVLQRKGINSVGLELNENAVNEAKDRSLCVHNQTIQEGSIV
jgi:SAM-dependent methyltransferase